MTAKINKLPQEVINAIAAGEVVERYSSIVKELVENSIDAGAKSIQISVDTDSAAITELSVSDDGDGIAFDDLKNALLPHHTSKISGRAALDSIRTLGFRGEALHSIGNVSIITIKSKARAENHGGSICAEFGKIGEPEVCAHPDGTSISVKEIFSNVPARKKFLRSLQTEISLITETVRRFAMCCHSIRFEYLVRGRREYSFEPAERLSRIAELIGLEKKDIIEHEIGSRGSVLTLYLCQPEFGRQDTSAQTFFVNGRFVRDKVIMRALIDGAQEFYPRGKFPVAVVFLTINPAEVDVNVHPAKLEVRFRRSTDIYNLVRYAVEDAYRQKRVAPKFFEHLETGPRKLTHTYPQIINTEAKPETAVGEQKAQPELVERKTKAYQLHNKFIVVEDDHGITVFDQHALHERILLEDIKATFTKGKIPSQALLIPEMLNVSPLHMSAAEQNKENLEAFGFNVEPFGHDKILIRGIPIFTKPVKARNLLEAFLNGAIEAGTARVLPFDAIMEIIACKSAVKFGDPLTQEEINNLVSRRKGLLNPHNCAHGRPMCVTLTLDDLERKLCRK